MSRTMTVTWRSENYGRYDGAKSAFRLYDTVDLSDAEVAQLHAAATKAGFSWEDGRCVWIAFSDTARDRFIAGLQKLGYAVAHAGSWSPPSTQASASEGL